MKLFGATLINSIREGITLGRHEELKLTGKI